MSRKPKSPKENLIIIPSAKEIATAPEPMRETTLDRVYRENGVTAESIRKQPKMTKMLQVLGGLEVAAEYLRGSEEPEAVKFLAVYDRVPLEEHDFLEFEGFCAAAQVSGKKLFGIIVAETAVNSEQTIALITAAKTPDVIEATFEMAMSPLGHREKKLVAQASGWLPRPKGAQTNIQINTANMAAQKGSASIPMVPFDQDIRELGERFQGLNADKGQKLLEGKVD